MNSRKTRICPVERACGLDNRIRRWLQNPRRILKPYIEEGMTVLEIGCGPGFFTIDMAEMVGESGRVIASDLQAGMLEKVKDKVSGTEFEDRVTLHKSEENEIGVAEPVDFVLMFYVVHEVPDKEAFFKQIASVLKPDGKALVVEPPFHVSKSEFKKTIGKARASGLTDSKGPKLLFSKTVILEKYTGT